MCNTSKTQKEIMKDKLQIWGRKENCVRKDTFRCQFRIILLCFNFRPRQRTRLHCAAVMVRRAAVGALVAFLIVAAAALPSTLLEDAIQAAGSESSTAKGKAASFADQQLPK
jgi:hypothetical protein